MSNNMKNVVAIVVAVIVAVAGFGVVSTIVAAAGVVNPIVLAQIAWLYTGLPAGIAAGMAVHSRLDR